MIILGIHAFAHDPSAALLVDGEVVAAADEERFTRRKHAVGDLPVRAARFCLEQAGVKPSEVAVVAYPWSRKTIQERRFEYIRHSLRRRPAKAIRAALKLLGMQRRRERLHDATLEALGIDRARTEVVQVEHHLAHAASAFHFSGFERAAILSLDGVGELATTLFAEGEGGEIRALGDILKPDSLGFFYATMTQFLGWESNDGEYKLMGMAPYGDPRKVDIADFVRYGDGRFEVNRDYVWSDRAARFDGGKRFSRALVDRLGPPRRTEGLSEPYIHIAAATQKLFEDAAMHLVEARLGPVLERTGRICLAGGCALNVVLNRRLVMHPKVKEVFVQPNAGDAGTSLGAAAFVAARRGERVKPMRHCYLGPSYGTARCEEALRRFRIPYEKPADIVETAADLLARGNPLAWFQGRMEWGPRALGARSILGHPGVKGQTDDINRRIKFRESWRPFCPSILAERGPDVFDTAHGSPYMTFCFGVREEWRAKLSEVVHVDGSARPQYVTAEANPRFRALIERFERKTGLPCVINTSLNRRGEPIVNTPEDAIAMFFGCGLEYLVLEDLLIRKDPRGA